MKLRKILAAFAGGAVVAAVAALWAPSAAWADTHPGLHQAGEHILASNPGYKGNDCNGVTAAANQDIWVFVWPGNKKVGTITSVTIEWDTNGDGVADTSRSYPSDATLITNGTPKIAFVTPAGWRLEEGTSTVTGYTSNGVFNLTHTCPGTPDNQVDPCVEDPSDPGCQPPDDEDDCLKNPDADECNPDPCVDTAAAAKPDFCTPPTSETTTTTTTTTTPGLPKTGSSLTGLLAAGAALVAAGGVTLFLLRRRRAATGE